MTVTTRRTHSVQLKADFFPMTVLKLQSSDTEAIREELSHIQTTAPNYFNNTPIVIDVSSITTQQALDLKQLKATLVKLNMQPMGIRGLSQELESLANQNGLNLLNLHDSKPTTPQPKAATKPSAKSTKVITKPVRAGTQIYAKDADLIIMAAVNAGAEIVADGNIHVHGPLRGRAIAGAKGDTQCRIFCQQLDAELISIAGRYLIKEHINPPTNASFMIHVSVNKDQLTIQGT